MKEELKYLLLIVVQILTFNFTPLIGVLHVFVLLYLTGQGHTKGRLNAAYITSGVGCLMFSENCLIYWGISAALSWGICWWLGERDTGMEDGTGENMPQDRRQNSQTTHIHQVKGDIHIEKAVFIKDYPPR